MLLEMRKGLPCKNLFHALASRWSIDSSQRFRQRDRVSRTLQRQYLPAIQQQLHAAPKPGPELDLAGNGALLRLGGQAGVQYQRIREFHRLTHGVMVAKCYRACNRPLIAAQS